MLRKSRESTEYHNFKSQSLNIPFKKSLNTSSKHDILEKDKTKVIDEQSPM